MALGSLGSGALGLHGPCNLLQAYTGKSCGGNEGEGSFGA